MTIGLLWAFIGICWVGIICGWVYVIRTQRRLRRERRARTPS